MDINSLKYLRSTTLGCKDIEIGKSEFVAKVQYIPLSKHIYPLNLLSMGLD